MSQVMLWDVHNVQRFSRLDAWTQPRILRVGIPLVPLERDLTEKSHKTSFKGHTKIACFSSPLPHLPSFSSWVHLPAIPLRGSKIASSWMDCQRPGGSPPQTAPALCPHFSDLPHQLKPRACNLAVCHLCPAETWAGALPLWVIFPPEPLWSESINQAWLQGGLLHQAATLENHRAG